ncbi:hypothetical protein GCM10009547_07180 [Sporichthya brevicatena]|uniref:Uncharacterized protein n=1 Tax=Sporichthya brevicatena TaxID=171442 RepID=A0ABP3RDU3_9ACTN
MQMFPLPPEEILNQPVNETGQTVMNIAIAVAVVAVYASAFRLSRKYRTPVPLIVALGSTFCALIEPMPDTLANLWYYAPGQDTFYTAFENPFPVWTFFSYTAFYGGMGLTFWRLVESGWSRRRLVPVCAGAAVYLLAAELFMINVMEVYTYYGPAAFMVGDFPTWIPLLNTFIVLTIGVGAARIRRSLPTREQFVPAFFLPAVAMVLGLVMIPLVLWTYIHSADPDQGVVYAITILTMGIAIAMMHTTMRLMPAEGFAPIGSTPSATPPRERVSAP